ncbi:MAG: DUF4255 domain-containing protein [Ignavibacteriota bacterium]
MYLQRSALVSASLRNLLLGEMQLNPAVPVTILAPDETGGSQRINLFLYKIEENAFLRNEDFALKPGNSSQLVPTPLSLNLYYLMTPYAVNDAQTGNTTAHEILGEAMRVFYENSVIPQQYLETELQGRARTIPHRVQRARPGGTQPTLDNFRAAVSAFGALPDFDRAD